MARRIKIKDKKSARGLKYWMAVGTLAGYTTFGSKAIIPAYAQQPSNNPATNTSNGQTQGLVVRHFDIPPGPLDAVLASFQGATGITVTVPREGLRTVASPGVAGLYSPEKALQKLLTDTGITFRFIRPDAVQLEIIGLSTSVEVSATVPPATLTKYTEPLVDTPQSISVVPQVLIQSQNATTLRDVLRNVAGLSIAAGEGGAQGDNLTIRGFTARNDLFLDGMRDFGSYYRDPFNFNEVDVLKGPSSVTFGRGSTGGVVNQETKTPVTDRRFSGSLNFGSDMTKRVTADMNQPLTFLGKGTAFRLNLMGHESNVAGRDIAENQRYGVAPSLAFGLGGATQLTLSYLREQADDTPDYGVPWLFENPAPVDRNNYYGFRHGNFLKTRVDLGTARVEHRFTDSVRVRSQLRFAHYYRDVRITEARVPTSGSGAVTPTTPLEDINVTRNQIGAQSLETFLQNQTDAIFTFHTGFIRHSLAAGVEGGKETSAPTRFDFAGMPGTGLLHPDETQQFEGTQTVRTRVHGSAVSFGTYALDTMRLGQKWELTGGLRTDRFDTDYHQFFPVIADPSLNRVDVMTSFRGAVVFKPVSTGSIYVGYGNSFNPSAESLSLAANTEELAPEESKTYEVGTKWDLFSRKLSLRGAIFRTDKTNAREPDPSNAALNILAGGQRVNGFEVEVSGRITSRWQLFSGYAYLNGKVTKSLSRPETIGVQLGNVPKNTFTLWNNYDTPWRLQVGGGIQFVDSRTASSTAPFDPITLRLKEVPGYVVVNAMARYPLTERIDLQLNAYNLADKYYFDQLHPGHIVPGPGRSVLGSVNYRF